jgi:hypothetical protein
MFYALVFVRPDPTAEQIDANLPADLDTCFAILLQRFQDLVNGPSPMSPTLPLVLGFLTYYKNNYNRSKRGSYTNAMATK